MSARDLVYIPFRTLGQICGDEPISITRFGDELFYTVAVGNRFQIFRGDKLTIALVSKPVPGTISKICTSNHDTFVVCGSQVFRYRRAHLMGEIFSTPSTIVEMISVGDVILCCDSSNNVVIYDIKSRQVVNKIKLLHTAKVTKIIHPATYLNKFLFGFEDGQLELWNIKTCKLVYEFKDHRKVSQELSAVSAMAQSPATDILAIGFTSGDILVMNIKLDVVLYRFHQKGEVTGISFRSDLFTAKFPYLLTSSVFGHIYIWSIENIEGEDNCIIKLVHTMTKAHEGSISTLSFLPGEPVFITSGSDNALRVWIFDNPDGSARLLKHRRGLSKYPRKLRYFGDLTQSYTREPGVYSQMSGLIAADDNGGLLFVRSEKDYDFQELSQKSLDSFSRGRLPTCLDFDFTYLGSKPWGDLVSIHEGRSDACLWKLEDKSSVKLQLKYPEKTLGVTATAVAMSMCGNFAVIGYSDGVIAKFNIQSGLCRGVFRDGVTESAAITGIFIDAANVNIIAIFETGYILHWNFLSQQLLHKIHLPQRLLQLKGIMANNFFAVVDEKNVVRMYDLETFKLGRLFKTDHSLPVSDLLFTPDSQRLITASFDHTLQVWDVASSRRITWLKFPDPITSIALLPSGDLVVGHQDKKNFSLCADRSLTEVVGLVTSFDKPVELDVDASLSESIEQAVEEVISPEEKEVEYHREDHELTLSSVSKSYWTNLCNLELIQRRNKLVRPVEKISIPFFIPLTSTEIDQAGKKSDSRTAGTAGTAPVKAGNESTVTSSKILKRKSTPQSVFIDWLDRCSSVPTKEMERQSTRQEFMKYLTQLTPTELDLQLQSLINADFPEEIDHLVVFLRLLQDYLNERKDFELVHAIVYRILLIHSSTLTKTPSLLPHLAELQSSLSTSSQGFHNMLHLTLCLIKNILSIPLT